MFAAIIGIYWNSQIGKTKKIDGDELCVAMVVVKLEFLISMRANSPRKPTICGGK